ncbi:MAG TPA: sugar phosphate isomerase/epimerase family protein [Gemmataceae bacterium]|jgi:sugar phosphate isomerase/epimerase|nr:sugar phosphate isomerase/epimerase family protein [Gemmataceae bacterium]
MKRKLSIGSWAYLFNQEKPTKDFHTILHKLHDLGYEGVELGAFDSHPSPETCDTKAKRDALKKEVKDHGLEFSGLAADLWSQKLWSTEDSGPFLAAFAKNVFFAEDLGIDTIRLDTVESRKKVDELNVDPKKRGRVVFERVARAFDLCSKLAASRGIKICWEFEPGFPLNKPSEIVELVGVVRDEMNNPNFGVLYDTCHAHMCAAIGANQYGEKETLPGGALELLHKLKGKITHLHLIDSDGSLNEHDTSTHNPFGTGKLDFDKLTPALLDSGVPNDWWCVDLCFWPNAWDVTADSKRYLDKLRTKYVK